MPSTKTPALRAAGTLAAVAALALTGCTISGRINLPGPGSSSGVTPAQSASAAASSSQLRSVHDPGQVTGTLTGHCQARDDGRLPDPHCTPGAVDPAVTQADIGSTICKSGYTETVRPPESQTEKFKFGAAYPAYGLAPGTETELDHLVPLELGGANDASNLWPEVGSLPNPKDSVENALKRAVCAGTITLASAQRAIAGDWETAEASLGLGASG